MAEQELPRYMLLKEFFAEDDTLYPEGTVITYTATPNEYMQPLNEVARDRMNEFQATLDAHAQLAAQKAGKAFTGRMVELGDQLELAKAIHDGKLARAAQPIIEAVRTKDIPLRPDLVPIGKRRGRPAKLLGAELPQPEGKPQPKPVHIMGRSYENDASNTVA